MLLLVTFVIYFTSVLKRFLYYQKKVITSMKIKEKMKNMYFCLHLYRFFATLYKVGTITCIFGGTMGAAKEKMMAIEARGYGESEKYVCSGCVRDPYLQKVIRAKGQVGTCSFCKNEKGKSICHRKTYPLESLMAKIMSVGQMVSLCVAPDAPDDLKEIHSVLQVVLSHAKNLHAYTTIHTQEPLYRCVNFHKFGFVPKGYTTIPATLVGTAPAKFAENGRFNKS